MMKNNIKILKKISVIFLIAFFGILLSYTCHTEDYNKNNLIKKDEAAREGNTIKLPILQDTINCYEPSFSDNFMLPYNIMSYFDFYEGIYCSKYANKPNLVYFTSHNSPKSREFEAKVMKNGNILRLLKSEFVITTLFTDDKMELPVNHHIISLINGDTIKIYGKKCLYYQMSIFKENTHPVFYIINSNEELLTEPYYFDLSVDSFGKFLTKGISAYE